MQLHLEAVEVEPLRRLLRGEVVVGVPGGEAEAVEARGGGEEDGGGALLGGNAGVSS